MTTAFFSENTGKLRTGQSCHHYFNRDKSSEIKTGIEKDVDHFIDDLDRYLPNTGLPIRLVRNLNQQKPKKGQKKKGNKRRITASDNRRKTGTCVPERNFS